MAPPPLSRLSILADGIRGSQGAVRVAQALIDSGLDGEGLARLESSDGRVWEGTLLRLCVAPPNLAQPKRPLLLETHRASAAAPARPLLLLTRGLEASVCSALGLLERGVDVVVAPCVQIVPPENTAPLRRCIEALDGYDDLLLTSRNGVRAFAAALDDAGPAAWTSAASLRTIAVGPGTREEAERLGLPVAWTPEEHTGEGLLAGLLDGASPRAALFPRAEGARTVLPDGLKAAGWRVDAPTAYRNVSPQTSLAPLKALSETRPLDAALFASPSAARSLFGRDASGGTARALLSGAIVGAIGPITAAALERLGARPDIVPETYTQPALSDAVLQALGAASQRS